jgi:hypothetical protein
MDEDDEKLLLIHNKKNDTFDTVVRAAKYHAERKMRHL